MKTKKDKELKDQMKDKNYQEFFQALGIDPKDFEDLDDDIDFDDYSN